MKSWRTTDPRVRQAILLIGAFEAGLKTAALVDCQRRSKTDPFSSVES